MKTFIIYFLISILAIGNSKAQIPRPDNENNKAVDNNAKPEIGTKPLCIRYLDTAGIKFLIFPIIYFLG